MSMTRGPAVHPDRQPLSLVSRILLFVGLPLLALALIVGAALFALAFSRGGLSPIDRSYEAAGGASVRVDVNSAAFDIGPSDDGQVHVRLTGSYSGPEPSLRVSTSGDRTTVEGGCPSMWFARCLLKISIRMPEAAELDVRSSNGRISVTELTGDVDVVTVNGSLDLHSMEGRLGLRTTNGAIRVTACSSSEVAPVTTNGRIDLMFGEAPTTVQARSTNGSITIRVPEVEGAYFVDADTTNGRVDTDDLPGDRSAERTISAITTNGNVTIERSAP